MDRRLRATPRASEHSHHRFLRAGALARLRDSKIVARSLRSSACLLLPRSALPLPAPPVVAAAEQAGVPRFLRTGCSGRYPLRRRVAAARGVAFLPPPPPPDTEAFLDALTPSSDLVSWR
uniref:Uncharacterized protein n=1 Tax=Arundo donax TaxID=35708 RepID=A0A0A9HAK0_ARUDO